MSDTTELVDLAVIFPDLEIELKYACADNITGKAIYQQARCLLHKDAITALAKSISIAQLSGLQLVIYDAYRPGQRLARLVYRFMLCATQCVDPIDYRIGSGAGRFVVWRSAHRNRFCLARNGCMGSNINTGARLPGSDGLCRRGFICLCAGQPGGGFALFVD
ncbi:D-ala-D-ala dipeptidase [Escherichia coli]|nr:D-ala-D-ala dipeptidase [Escherichia coli]